MKEIPVFGGHTTLVDDDDYEMLTRSSWHISHGYVVRCHKVRGKSVTDMMHRVIMNPLPDMRIDHINHNRLDNRKENLRFCTQAENCRNSRKMGSFTSKYKGVHWSSRGNNWCAQIRKNYKRMHIGYFETEEEAARAYNWAAIEYFGEFACLNAIEVDYGQV